MERTSVYKIRYYALGHSYLRHSPFRGWHWEDPEKGNRGMAASTVDKDYFARFQAYLKQDLPCKIESIAENIASYERLCVDGMTAEQYRSHALYASIQKHLTDFSPNLVTVFVGGGNTIANDFPNISLFFEVLFELIRRSVGEQAIVIAANHMRPDTDVGRACIQAAEKYGFAYCDISFLHERTDRDNPYYAFAQYPEYDDYAKQYQKENGGIAPIEFRTHPGDFGMDAIGKAFHDVAMPLLLSHLTPCLIDAAEWENGQAETERRAVEVQPSSVEGTPQVSSKLRFDFDGEDCEGVFFNGFNVYVKNSMLCGNSAPGTGFSISHESLHLNGESLHTFEVRMNVYGNARIATATELRVKLDTEDGIFESFAPISLNEMKTYSFDISAIHSRITGFYLAPSLSDCNGDVDWIAFE